MSAQQDGPPSYNMGVTLGEKLEKQWGKDRSEATGPNLGVSFDWYQATFPCPYGETLVPHTARLVSVLADALKPSKVKDVERGLHGYKRRTLFEDAKGGVTLMILHGGQEPNVTATSHRADAFADLARHVQPGHRVSRVDVAMDFEEKGGWTKSLEICREVMTAREMESGVLLMPDKPEKGATYYMGARSSPVMARLYQKGYEQLKRNPECGASEDWVRLELQVRPQKEAKNVFATASRDEVWGSTKWSRDLMERFTGWSPAGLRVAPRSESDWERTHRFMIQQYASHLEAGGEHLFYPVAKWLKEGGLDENGTEMWQARHHFGRRHFREFMMTMADDVWEELEKRKARRKT